MHTFTDPSTVVLAGDIMDWATQKTEQIRTLVLTAASVMAIIAVLMAWWRTKSWVGTLVAFVLAALVLWGIANMPALKSKVGSEIEDNAVGPAVVQVVGAPPSVGGIGRLR